MGIIGASLVALAASLAQIALAVGVGRHLDAKGLEFATSLLRDPLIWTGLSVYAGCALAWLWILSKSSVAEVYPVLSLTFVLVPLLSWATGANALAPMQWIAIVLICSGVAVLQYLS